MPITDTTNCRVCLQTQNSNVSLMAKCANVIQNLTYMQVYNECTLLCAEETDELPQSICMKCAYELALVYNFLEVAKQSSLKLQEAKIKQRQQTAIVNNSLQTTDNEEPEQLAWEDEETSVVTMSAVVMDEQEAMSEAAQPTEDEQTELFDAQQKKCEVCSLTFESQYLLDSHQRMHAVDPTIVCDICQKCFCSNSALKAHHRCHTGEGPFRCNVCDQSFHQWSAMSYHKKYKHHENTMKCPECGKMFSCDIDFQRHCVTHNQCVQKRRWSCSVCQKVCKTLWLLVLHMKRHIHLSAQEQKEQLMLQTADETVSDLYEMLASDELEQTSQISENTAATETEPHQMLNQKLIINMSGKRVKRPEVRIYVCKVCGAQFQSTSNSCLRYHMQQVHAEPTLLCNYCPKSYYTQHKLNTHLRTHTNERPFECKHCGDKFKLYSTLINHERRHTNDRRYTCKICGKRFIQSSSMMDHMKSNHLQRTFCCKLCDKKFSRRIDLHRHIFSHTGEQPYACDHCNNRYTSRSALNNHQSKMHGVVVKKRYASTLAKTLTQEKQQQQPLELELQKCSDNSLTNTAN